MSAGYSNGCLFDLKLADGRRFRSCRIQGRGGEIGCADIERTEESRKKNLVRVQELSRRAAIGRPLGVYEPEPGHVKIYVGKWHGDTDDETVEIVPLAGALVRLAAHESEGAK